MLQPEVLSKELSIMPFFRLAFRPFFLLPVLLSILSLIVWLAVINGAITWKGGIAVNNWHGHEMVFGFAASIVIGFLLTAAQTWTGVRSIHGWNLALLVLCWLVARIAFISNSPAILIIGMIAQLIWWAVSVAYLSYMLIKSNNGRNLVFIPLLLLLATLNATMLYASITYNISFASHLAYLAVLMITAVVTILGGRVIPFFTTRALNLPAINAKLFLERFMAIVMALTIACFALSYWFNLSVVLPVLFLIAGACQIARMANWRTLSTLKTPLLWSLHFAYLNMGIGYVALGSSYYFNVISFSAALHIITVGTIGTMTLAMMSRVSLGHTARSLQSNGWVNLSFAVLLIATLLRFILPLFNLSSLGYLLAGIGWALGFGIFLIYYTPILLKARTDGRSG
ncbi:NnrS family protein [Thalassotalea piscium]|uniref:Uncharacterized protein involved in response to NO n=1 Tax=Thalassotalea piscium TaxID=1230533 RepID=A0A7X0NIS8_9GAMM|nr:NnrS family protein [Thalassotalea piscium]MBB6544233.1 uncharacterized protein involved in response to NO [Thalassotalea piscium]